MIGYLRSHEKWVSTNIALIEMSRLHAVSNLKISAIDTAKKSESIVH